MRSSQFAVWAGVFAGAVLISGTSACTDGGGGDDDDDVSEICDNAQDDDGDGLIDCDDLDDCAHQCGACPSGQFGEDCEFFCSAGDGAPCSDHGSCDDGVDGTGECTCDTGFAGEDCAVECPGGADTPCGGNGICDDGAAGSGACSCEAGFFGDDCVSECPGGATTPCSGSGTCDDGAEGSGACTCEAGFFGDECVSECPGGATNSCSGTGTCDDGGTGTGECTCDTGYFGADCAGECPGGAAAPCSGNGTCDDGALGAGTCTCAGAFVGPDCAYEPGPVTVNVTCNSEFWAGFVIFHDASGAVIDFAFSDFISVPKFTASQDPMPPGGMITVGTACDEGVGTDFYYRMHTLTEILPDRTYDLDVPYNSNSFIIPSDTGDLFYDPQLPAAIVDDVVAIITDAGCELPQQRAVGAPPLSHNITLACLNFLTGFDLVLRAVDVDGNVLATAESPVHPYTNNGDTPDVVTISAWTVAPAPFRTLFQNAPDFVMMTGQLRAVRNGYDYLSVFALAAPFPLTELGSAAFDWDIAPGFADAYRYDFSFVLQDRPGEVRLSSRRLTPDASYDLMETFQPEVTTTDLTYDRTARQWSVTLDAGAPVHTNTFVATFRWWNPDFDEGGTWHVYVPTFGDVVTPAIPTDAELSIIWWWLPADDPIIEHSFWYEIWDVIAPVDFTDLVDIWGTVLYPALLGDLEAITDDYDVWVTHFPQPYRQTGL